VICPPLCTPSHLNKQLPSQLTQCEREVFRGDLGALLKATKMCSVLILKLFNKVLSVVEFK